MKTICGEKAKLIAEELKISIATVKSDLIEARRSGMVMAARDTLVNMVPKALAVLDTHLEAGDKDVALVVLEGLGIIGKNMLITMVPPGTAREDTFYEFRARVLQTKQAGSSTSGAPNAKPVVQISGPILDAEVETPGVEGAGEKGVAAETV